MTERRTLIASLAATLVAAALFVPSAGAQTTSDKLEAAKDRLEHLDAQAQEATAEFDAAQARLARTQDQIAETKAQIEAARARVGDLRERLALRARNAYVQGASSTLDILLESKDFSEFSDRIVFLDRLAQMDSDLVTRTQVRTEQLRRLEEDLGRLSKEQKKTLAIIDKKKDQIYANLEEAQALREKLEKQLEAEQSAFGAGFGHLVKGAALQYCPVPGASYSDTFGAPRSGGRTHEGTDMMAPPGTPIHAAQTGNAVKNSGELQGKAAWVYADNGDSTFYAHMSGWAQMGHVSAGTVIGYVGDTGNAAGTPHLHFEYHPGGGAAVDPYPYLNQVC